MNSNYFMNKTKLLLFTILFPFCFTASAQYCNTNLGGSGCAATDQINDVEIKNEFLEEITRLRNANESLVKLKSSLEPAIGKVRKSGQG